MASDLHAEKERSPRKDIALHEETLKKQQQPPLLPRAFRNLLQSKIYSTSKFANTHSFIHSMFKLVHKRFGLKHKETPLENNSRIQKSSLSPLSPKHD